MDWDFRGEDYKTLTHGMHTYPATMIPQIARRLLETYGKEGDTVLDPFCGSGTTLVEASTMGFDKVWGVDMNPLARMISAAKTTPIPVRALCIIRQMIMLSVTHPASLPTFKNINYWFKPEVIVKLQSIKEAIDAIADSEIRQFYKVCFSETVRTVSNTRNGEFKLYRLPPSKLAEFNPDVFLEFGKIVERNIKAMSEYNLSVSDRTMSCQTSTERSQTPTRVQIFDDDAMVLQSIPDNSVDLIVTSPPYGDSQTTVAYGQFSRLSLEFLGFDESIRKLDDKMLGGKDGMCIPRLVKTNKIICSCDLFQKTISEIEKVDKVRADEVRFFFGDLFMCFSSMDRVLKPGGHICMVVGNRTVCKIQIPTDKIIVEKFLNMCKYEHIETIERNLTGKRMPLEIGYCANSEQSTVSTMNKEYIIILKKTG